MSHDEAVGKLEQAGIAVSSSGNCSDRANPSCTSFEQVRPATIDGAIALRENSGCPMRATGGTEVGHEISRPESHYNGYKIDIGRSDCVDDYIRSTYRSVPPTYGSEAYVSPAGDVYVNEGSHWDIVYTGTGAAPNPLPPPENEPLEFVNDLLGPVTGPLGLPELVPAGPAPQN